MTTDDRADEPCGDWRPTASWITLQRRAALLCRLRAFFNERGFVEVETPQLSADMVVDRHLDPFAAGVPAEMGKPARRYWLQTSPEFGMKRLLAAGATAIYQVCHAFRLGERGPLHNPEFTMVEWYRAGDDLVAGIQFTSDLAEAMLARGPAERISYAEAFERHVGVDPHRAPVEDLIAATARHGIAAPESFDRDDRDGWLDLLLSERVQPRLGTNQPAILYDYPASQAALARVRPGDVPVAERFELYADGIELANGYHELLDAAEFRQRNTRTNQQREADGKAALPEQSRLLDAMAAGLPPSVGVALGFDRLAMVALGLRTIQEVIALPFDRA